jgi:3-phenylpropionate/trans-cinnamate dioxygenase ferredoxin reductase subunit
MPHIAIVGAGQAAASLAAKLRTLGYEGEITIFGDEPVPPYQRPPLSKKYLLGELDEDRLYLRPESFYADQGIALRLGAPVTAIVPQEKRLTVGSATVAWDQLALVTGSVPRRLPAGIGGALDGVHTVRTLADIDAMRDALRPGARVLIVGGGYIGLEAAAVAAQRGLRVTLVEAAPRILQRVACPETSAWFAALHRSHGVDLREGTGLARLTGEGRVTGAELTDGSRVAADFVIVGVGITPATALAEAAGIACDNGIAADAQGRTSAHGVWAAGDCASFPWQGGRLRLESVQNAIDMAETVAGNMLGAGQPYRPLPWFWSDQYDVALQIAGLNTGYDRIVIRDAGAARSHWYYRGADFLAVDAMNDARAYMVGKRLLEAGRSPAPEAVADPATDLKALLKG